MSQPVIDTLQLCDALRKTGMEREQAEGLARALGNEFGAHVAVRGDLESGFQGVRNDLGSKIEQVRCDLELKIQAVDTKVDVLRAELAGRMDGLEGRMDGRMDGLDRKIDALNWKLTFMVAGFALLMSVLTVASGMGVFERSPRDAQPPSVMGATARSTSSAPDEPLRANP